MSRDLGLALAVAAGVLVLQLPFHLCSANLIDEGAIMQLADELLHGRRLYADMYHPALPGVHWLTAAVFALFGTSFGNARMLAVVLFAITVGAVYVIARWSHSRRGAFAVVLLFVCYRVWAYPHWHMLSYSSLTVGFVMIATAVLGEAFARPARWPYALAGVLVGCGIVTKQDSGAAGAAALGLALIAGAPAGARLRRLLPFTAGTVAVLAPAVAAVLHAGIGRELVQHTIIAPLFALRHFAYPGRPALWPLFAQDVALRAEPFTYFPPIIVDLHWLALNRSALYRETAVVDVALKTLYYLPWIVFLAALAVRLVRGARWDGSPEPRIARENLLLLLAAAFLAAFNRPHDWIHLLVLFPPTLLLGALLLARLVESAARWRRPLVGGIALALALATTASVVLAVQFGHHHASRVDSLRGPLYASAPQARALREALDILAAAPAQAPLAALPYHPLLNFISARPLVSRFYALWPIEPNPRREEEVIGDIERQGDAVVVYSPTRIPHFPVMREYVPVLFRYLVDHFGIERTAGGDPDGYTFVLLRRTPPAAGRSLLGAPLAAARVRFEPPDGPARDASPEERPRLIGEALWPFQPVLRVTTLPTESVGVSFPLRPQPGDRIELSYGLNPDRWLELPPTPVRFAIAVESAGTRHEVLARELDPRTRAADRAWIPARVDLSRWAGGDVALVLRVTGPAGEWPQFDRAGWGDPRLVSRPETSAAP